MGKSATKAKNKYNATNYDRVGLMLPKGIKEQWQEEAERRNMSLNAFIQFAVGKCLETEK